MQLRVVESWVLPITALGLVSDTSLVLESIGNKYILTEVSWKSGTLVNADLEANVFANKLLGLFN